MGQKCIDLRKISDSTHKGNKEEQISHKGPINFDKQCLTLTLMTLGLVYDLGFTDDLDWTSQAERQSFIESTLTEVDFFH